MTSPTTCFACGGPIHIVTEQRDVRLGRRTVKAEDTFARCDDCGEEVYLPGQLDATRRRAAAIVRDAEGRLTPGRIQEIRGMLGLSQSALETLIGAGPKTVVRWERGTVIPNGPADSLLRLIEHSSPAVEFLAELRGMTIDAPVAPNAEAPGRQRQVVHYSAPESTEDEAIQAYPPRRWDRLHKRARRVISGDDATTFPRDYLKPEASNG